MTWESAALEMRKSIKKTTSDDSEVENKWSRGGSNP